MGSVRGNLDDFEDNTKERAKLTPSRWALRRAIKTQAAAPTAATTRRQTTTATIAPAAVIVPEGFGVRMEVRMVGLSRGDGGKSIRGWDVDRQPLLDRLFGSSPTLMSLAFHRDSLAMRSGGVRRRRGWNSADMTGDGMAMGGMRFKKKSTQRNAQHGSFKFGWIGEQERNKNAGCDTRSCICRQLQRLDRSPSCGSLTEVRCRFQLRADCASPR